MIPLFSTEQIREIDNFAINKIEIPGLILMENASISIFQIALEKILNKKLSGKTGFVCGKGNNGGDGFAAARHFANNGFKVTVIYLGNEDSMSKDCKINFDILKNLSAQNKNIKLKNFTGLNDLKELSNCDVIFDAMLGSGFSGELTERYKSIIIKLNSLKCYKAAIDIPTGLDADLGFAETAFKSDLTITLGEFKKGLFFGDGSNYSGEIIKGDIGINQNFFDRYDPKEFLIEPEDAFYNLPKKDKKINKYSSGKVLTIAGSGKFPGAAALTAKSVLRIGAGASILAFPKSIRNLIQKKLDEVVVESFEDNHTEFLREKNIDDLQKKIKWADALALGPGLGRENETQRAVLKILKERKFKRIVIDADAIFALGKNKYKNLNLKNFVFTPHYGEFANLISVEVSEIKKDILKYGRKFTDETGAFLVLKDAPTLIFNPAGEVFVNTSGNPGMAKFGTGDVLTGVIAGFLSQINNIEEALISAVYIHSLTADLLVKKYTKLGYTAANIINYLPNSIKLLRDSFV